MSTFVVAVVRLPRVGGLDAPARAARVRAVDELARGRGGRLVANGASSAAFAFPPAAAAQALAFVAAAARAHGTLRVGLARGPLAAIAGAPGGDDAPWLACGAGLDVAASLARRARDGEVMCSADVHGPLASTVATLGPSPRAPGGRPVRLDATAPFRAEREARLQRLLVPPYVGDARSRVVPRAGAIVVVRAARGAGGTRLLEELAAASPRALLVAPAGNGVAPLGALREAIVRAGLGRAAGGARGDGPPAAGMVGALESHVAALRNGRFVDAVTASRVVRLAVAHGGEPRPLGVVLVDDAERVDAASLEAVARAASDGPEDVAVVVRLAPGAPVPGALSALATVAEVPIGDLRAAETIALASACVDGGLTERVIALLVRHAPKTPLAVTLAVEYGIASGAIAPSGDGRFDLRRGGAVFARAVRSSASLATALVSVLGPEDARLVTLLGVLGGSASYDLALRALGGQGGVAQLDATATRLKKGPWLAARQDGLLCVGSRTMTEAIVAALSAEEATTLRRTAAAALRALDLGPAGAVEAAAHDGAAGDPVRGGAELLEAARAAERAGLPGGAVHLAAQAVALDATLEDQAGALLLRAGAAPRATSVGRTASQKLEATRSHASPARGTPATVSPLASTGEGRVPAIPGSTPPAVVPPPARASNRVPAAVPSAPPDVSGLPALTKSAVRGDDGLDRWLEGPGATLDNPRLGERLRAMARIGRGEAPDAVRMLRRARTELDEADLSGRCRTSLALAVALSAAGRSEEALLEGLDALARAREAADDPGGRACLAFLAKLYASVGRLDEARRLSPT